MKSLCFTSSTSSSSIMSPSRTSLSSTPRRRSMIETTIDAAATIIMKWDAEASAYAGVSSLFHGSKREVMQFIKSVNDLQEIMHLLVSHQVSDPETLTQAQNLMQIAMKRLQKEFYQILSMNRADLDPESVSTRKSRTSTRISTLDYDDNGSPDDEIRTVGDYISEDDSFTAKSDLKLIADCMIASGYAKECINIYKTIRKSITDKKLPMEKLICILDMYIAVSEDWQAIETIFSFESASSVRLQALNSLVRLSESVHSSLTDFESKIQKDSSKAMIPGGGLHPLTIYSMNCLTLLADYRNILTEIISDWPPTARSSIPEPFLDIQDSDESPAPAISVRFARLILVLLCKLDGKSNHYKDVSQSYLFLANNLQHIISGVRTSNLMYVLGEDWLAKHEAKVRQYAANYERLAWGKVFDSLSENPTVSMTDEETKECFKNFTSSFEDAYIKQSSSVVPDPKLRDKIKLSIGTKLVGVYREFHDTHKSTVRDESRTKFFVRFSPEDVSDYLSNLFFMTMNSKSSSISSSGSSRHRRSPLRA
ncbi:Ankyrin repeat family protein isoform 1 [Hibiscus syriacus]|uniref:Exocyst subunit Exo70 family protein n=2 Tax=Hibiscus syriacus TaxID=106335 RepID=A0A6A2ZLE8_HIBSY|nr:Ankyrin repeat family protein isoform 1 [Hibiscus syriacus]